MNISFYKYKGATFTKTAGNNRIVVKDDMIIGLRPIKGKTDMYLCSFDAPNITYKISARKASDIAKNCTLVRVPSSSNLNAAASKIVEAATNSRDNADRYIPVQRPQNEVVGRNGVEPTGVLAARCQWRVLTAATQVQTNKAGRVLNFKAKQMIGLRFTSPSKGGILVTQEGVYEPLATDLYDSVVKASKVLPKDKWPTNVIPVSLIQAYRDGHEAKRVKDRNAIEKQERQEDAVHREQIREAKQGAAEQERQVVKDGQEFAQIAKEVAEGAKKADATAAEIRKQQLAEQAANLDKYLRNMKAGKMESSTKHINVSDVDDVDAGDDVEVAPKEEAEQQDPVVAKQVKTARGLFQDSVAIAQKVVVAAKKAGAEDVTKGLVNDIRAAYIKAVAAIKSGAGEKAIDKFDDEAGALINAAKTKLGELDDQGVPKENAETGGKVERKPVASGDEGTDTTDDTDTDDTDVDDTDVDDTDDTDDGADDNYDDISDKPDHSALVDGDTKDDDDGTDLNDVDEEDGKAAPAGDEEDADIDDQTSDAGDKDTVQDADVTDEKDGSEEPEDAEVGSIVVFHDDKKQQRKFIVVGKGPSAKNKDIVEYKLWDKDAPTEYRVVRCSTKHGQSLGVLVDIKGKVGDKTLAKLGQKVDVATLNPQPIKS